MALIKSGQRCWTVISDLISAYRIVVGLQFVTWCNKKTRQTQICSRFYWLNLGSQLSTKGSGDSPWKTPMDQQGSKQLFERHLHQMTLKCEWSIDQQRFTWEL